MAKRIVICCDGTGNEIDDHQSNVLKFFRTLRKSDTQVIYYDPGLGTLGAHNEWARVKQNMEKILGLVLGYGLDRNVLNAYRFLVEQYNVGDQIYLYGFSRGAYTVRVLAGLVNAMGLLRREQVNLCSFVYTAYKQLDGTAGFSSIRLYEKTLRPRHPSIRFLGLWDTVSSVIVPRKDRLHIPSFRRLAHTASNPSVQAVRHALALDERRRMFQPYLWLEGEQYWGNPFKSGEPILQDVEQCWFAGVHADIGGGYAEDESGLSKITLDWMIKESPPELDFVTQTVNQVVLGEQRTGSPYVYAKPNPLAKLHESLTLSWWPLECIPRRLDQASQPKRRRLLGWYVPLAEPRDLGGQPKLHSSVTSRIDGGLGYNPVNLP